MILVHVPDSAAVVAANAYVCLNRGNPHACNDVGRVESALHTAFYPGSVSYIHGDIPALAGAMCYLVQSHAFMDGNKRTGALVAATFLNLNGFELRYNLEPRNELADAIEACAAGKISKEKLTQWFGEHSIPGDPTFFGDL